MDSTFADHFMQYLNGKGLYVTEEDNDSESDFSRLQRGSTVTAPGS